MKITDYRVVQEDYDVTINNIVKEYIEKGWQPLGGICVVTDESGDKSFYQAMVKREAMEDILLK